MSKILELAKKLHSLAQKGVGGERDNAVRMLELLLKKHGISMEDIEGERIVRFDYTISKGDQKFFTQVVSSVFGKDFTLYHATKGSPRGKKIMAFYSTHSQFIEVVSKFEFYLKRYTDDLETFYSAFIQKNALYAKPDENDETESEPLSEDQSKKLWKMMRMMESMDRHQFLKQLSQ